MDTPLVSVDTTKISEQMRRLTLKSATFLGQPLMDCK